ncbi:hypothetical protein QJS10_CPA02g00890 [Acorus calamus]|uniref:Uncharacterized protein n=1 Tax=Acorus calamus TaxID=4465 RepID=A0AAV9FB99_ACOCL|nr:hypothetical protein QJS10_CPA02g00890 [Acorus calamus]
MGLWCVVRSTPFGKCSMDSGAWSWSILLMYFVRGVSQLSVSKCGAVSNPIFVYVLVIVRVTYVVVFGLDLGSHRTVMVYSSL